MMKPKPETAILVAVLAFFVGAALIGCGSAPTTPDPVIVGAGTHGSSLTAGAAACTVAGAAIDVEVGGVHTGGYFSASDQGVSLLLKWVFASGSDKDPCPGPTRADWHVGNINDAACRLTGDTHRPVVFIDCPFPGQSSVSTTAFYPDGTTEVVSLGVTVSLHDGVRAYEFKPKEVRK